MTAPMSPGSPTRPASATARSIASSPIEARKSPRIGVSVTPGLTDRTRTPPRRNATDATKVHSIRACLENL